MERNDYQVERTINRYNTEGRMILNRESVENKELIFVKGKSAARSSYYLHPVDKELPSYITKPGLPFDTYVETDLDSLVKQGVISDGSNSPFDDRKLRFDHVYGYDDKLFVAFGATHYKDFLKDQKRDDGENALLQKQGINEFRDRYAFFSRCPGIAVLPITKEGSVFVGERTNEEAGGFLNAVAGHLKFRNPEEVDLMKDLNRELGEFGIRPSSLIGNPIFVGVYSNPIKGDLDFTYIARTNISEEYFTSGIWKEHATEREHKPLIKLASMGDINRLLEEGKVPDGREFPLMYSTRGALESVTEEELRAL